MGSFWGANIVGISFPIVQYHSNLYTKKKKKKKTRLFLLLCTGLRQDQNKRKIY